MDVEANDLKANDADVNDVEANDVKVTDTKVAAQTTATSFLQIHTQFAQGQAWCDRYRHCRPTLACVLGFTETGLVPGISAAGATPRDRQYTAIADAEFLVNGPQSQPTYPLPPLHVGASPVLLTRAVVAAQALPVYLFNAGLPIAPAVPAIDLGGQPAQCVSTGYALPLPIVQHLLTQGLHWGEKLAATSPNSYVILAECVVGGTTTALAVLTGLGFAAQGKVNSSHPTCNHAQKWALVQTGLTQADLADDRAPHSPVAIVAAVGDPMQIVVAGMAIAASRQVGVLLAGGTQMLAVYALAAALAQNLKLDWHPEQIAVGTTPWVVADRTADAVGLANLMGSVPLLSTQLSLANSQFPELRAYERGYVKEGVGAGACAIAAHLHQDWGQAELLAAIDQLAYQYQTHCFHGI